MRLFCCCKPDILDQEDVPWLSLEGQHLRCYVKAVYDADTVTLVVPFDGKPYLKKCRLAGIDAPEIRTKDLEEKAAGYAARDWLRGEILGKKVWVDCGGWDKYGRLLGTIYRSRGEKINSLNDELVRLGMACVYGWKKDDPDERDHRFEPNLDVGNHLPRTFSLRDKMPSVLSQGKLGSCTANGIANGLRFLEMTEGIDNNKPRSRLFIYYNERKAEGHIYEDSGAQIRDGIKSVNSIGACFEDTWPYDSSKFTDEPTPECYKEAKKHRTVKYRKVNQTVEDIKTALFSGYPIVFGFVVYESIENPQVKETGIIPMPRPGEKVMGGHCILLTGFNCNKRLFEIQNSWTTSWGDDGFGYMSYDYLTNPKLADDLWLITYTE